MDTMSFAKLVDTYRNSRGLDFSPITYATVARRFGVSRQHLYNLMKGEQMPSPELVVRIAKALELTTDAVRKSLRITAETK